MYDEGVFKISFWANGKDGLSLREFLAFHPEIQLTEVQVEKIAKYLTAFCFIILQEISDEIGEQDIHLTFYLQSLVGINEKGQWYVTPLRGMKMFFHGLRMMCIYDVTYRASN